LLFHKTFPLNPTNNKQRHTQLHTSKDDEFEGKHKHDRLIMLACFLTSALIGYFLTNHVALIGV